MSQYDIQKQYVFIWHYRGILEGNVQRWFPNNFFVKRISPLVYISVGALFIHIFDESMYKNPKKLLLVPRSEFQRIMMSRHCATKNRFLCILIDFNDNAMFTLINILFLVNGYSLKASHLGGLQGVFFLCNKLFWYSLINFSKNPPRFHHKIIYHIYLDGTENLFYILSQQ